MTISALIDDSHAVDGSSFLFESPSAVISASVPGEVGNALADMEAALKAGSHLAGFFAYELGYLFEPRLGPLLPNDLRVPLLWFGVFAPPLKLSGGEVDELLRGDRDAGYAISDPEPAMDREKYRERFRAVKNYIAAGDVYQLNLTFKANFGFDGSARSLYADLRTKQPVNYGALIETPDVTIVSASPELFLEAKGHDIFTRPMKGTAARGPSLEKDHAVAEWLAGDLKSRAENLMIVDLMRNDLGRVAEMGSVTVSDLFTVETYRTLHQMTSGVAARLAEGVGLTELIRSIFPPGSVTGAPKMRAIEIIRELEGEPRGVYTGAVGMLSPNGDARFNVAIRTLTLTADGRGEIGIGSGIVQDSLVDDEYDECLLKMLFLTEPAEPFELIETMRHDPGQGYYLLERHLARLADSATYFDFAFDRSAISTLLKAEAQNFGPGHQRVRLLLGLEGRATITAVPIDAPAETGQMTYVFSDHRVDSSDAFLYHKTTRRELYDREHAQLSAALGCDEVLFLNERGEITEGSRTNIFIERDGVLLTPALQCGLLPGTLRGELLASGKARQAVLYPRDLERAEAVFLGNSVRGLVRGHAIAPVLARAAGAT